MVDLPRVYQERGIDKSDYNGNLEINPSLISKPISESSSGRGNLLFTQNSYQTSTEETKHRVDEPMNPNLIS